MQYYHNDLQLREALARLAASLIHPGMYQALTDMAHLSSVLEEEFNDIYRTINEQTLEIKLLKQKIEELEKARQPNPALDIQLE